MRCVTCMYWFPNCWKMPRCSLSKLECEIHLHTYTHTHTHTHHRHASMSTHTQQYWLWLWHTLSAPLWCVFWPWKVNLIVDRFAPLWTTLTLPSSPEGGNFSSVAKQQAQPNYPAKENTAEQLMRIQKTQLQMPDIAIDKNQCLWFKWNWGCL